MFTNKDMSVGDWFLYYILQFIPVVNIIVFLVVLFSSNSNKSLKNLLILQVILFIVWIAAFYFFLPDILIQLEQVLLNLGLI
jgi:hypothetical protein